MRVLLVDNINQISNNAFRFLRLKVIKYYKSSKNCEICFLYNGEKQEAKRVEEYALKILPPNVKYAFLYTKVEPSTDNIKRAVIECAKEEINAELPLDNIIVTISDPIKIELLLEDVFVDFAKDTGFAKKLEDCLDQEFCTDFLVTLKQSGVLDVNSAIEELKQTPEPVKVSTTPKKPRVIKVFKHEKFIGDIIREEALYIQDAKRLNSGCVLCGTVSNVDFRSQPSKANPEKTVTFLKFTLTDFTDSVDAIIFGNKATSEKLERIANGDQIIAEGIIETNQYGMSFKIGRISYCQLPGEFKISEYKRFAPDNYSKIIPQAYEDEDEAKATTLLGDAQVIEPPAFFKGKTFVVFDVETTGTDKNEDRITELGAVKIVDGKITETFCTLINPQRPISQRASEVSNITDDMVADAPLFTEVCGDFYKFCDGAELVGQNVSFDMGFINQPKDETEYVFNHKTYDTLIIAKNKVKGLTNYKLGTIINHFNIKNTQAHRALSDTIATAKLFIKLMDIG